MDMTFIAPLVIGKVTTPHVAPQSLRRFCTESMDWGTENYRKYVLIIE